jgi:hypothetical protein
MRFNFKSNCQPIIFTNSVIAIKHEMPFCPWFPWNTRNRSFRSSTAVSCSASALRRQFVLFILFCTPLTMQNRCQILVACTCSFNFLPELRFSIVVGWCVWRVLQFKAGLFSSINLSTFEPLGMKMFLPKSKTLSFPFLLARLAFPYPHYLPFLTTTSLPPLTIGYLICKARLLRVQLRRKILSRQLEKILLISVLRCVMLRASMQLV